MSDKMREEFETFYLTEYDELTIYGNSVFERRETFCGDDIVDSCEYANEEVQNAWEWWAKSRAALVVELPPTITAQEVHEVFEEIDPDDVADIVNGAIASCAAFIHAAGVSTK